MACSELAWSHALDRGDHPTIRAGIPREIVRLRHIVGLLLARSPGYCHPPSSATSTSDLGWSFCTYPHHLPLGPKVPGALTPVQRPLLMGFVLAFRFVRAAYRRLEPTHTTSGYWSSRYQQGSTYFVDMRGNARIGTGRLSGTPFTLRPIRRAYLPCSSTFGPDCGGQSDTGTV